MRSPDNTELDLVEDMDYEESHMEVTEEDKTATPVECNIFASSDDTKALDEENASKVSNLDETKVLEASTIPEKLPEVGLDKTQVIDASATLEHSAASETPEPGTPASARTGIEVGMTVPITPGFPRMNAPRAVPVPSQGEEFCVPDHALDFSVPTILEIDDNEDGDDEYKVSSLLICYFNLIANCLRDQISKKIHWQILKYFYPFHFSIKTLFILAVYFCFSFFSNG